MSRKEEGVQARTETIAVERVRGCAAERFGALGAGLLERMEADAASTPTLLVAELTGDAILLGRHQRAASALELRPVREAGIPIARRAGGGRAVRAGEGAIGVLLAIPGPGALLPARVGADKVINRYVRGLLAGLTAAAGESGVHYFGRDFVSAQSRQLGVVSQDGSASGAAIFEAVIGVERTLSLPEGWSGYPEHEDPRAAGPAPVALSALWKEPHAFDDLVDRLAAGYERIYGCTAAHRQVTASEAALPEPPALEEEEGWEESGVADVAIGFAEALLRHDGERVEAVRLRGDFIAPAFALRALEDSLAGCPLDFTELGSRVDAAFKRPGAAILGLRSLRVLPDAVLAAAGRL